MTLEVGQFRKGANDKWRFVKLGYAKKNDKGQLVAYLDALPLPDERGCSIIIQERREQDQRAPEPQRGGGPMGDIDDSIPFAPEWRG